MARFKRKRLFVDSQVQGTLLLRTVSYWLYCLLAIGLLLVCWQVATNPGQALSAYVDFMWSHFAAAMTASLVMLPIVIIDSLRLSNRFAGPMLRLRRSMKGLANGEHVKPIHFRDGDFWRDVAADFNAIAARMDELTRARHASESTEEEPVGV